MSTLLQQERMLSYVRSHNIYSTYYPMLCVMIGTGVRCGELIGLTWDDIELKKRTVTISNQLIYRNLGDGCSFHLTSPKTECGIRTIPMTQPVSRAFEQQRKINFMLGKDRDFTVDGYKGFIFTARTGRPLMPSAVNNVLYNIVDSL